MEGNARVGSGDGKTSNGEREQGENSNLNEQEAIASIEAVPRQSSARTPFTNLTQEEADLALARTLQEQERAYMMLRMNNDGSDYGSWEGSYLHDDENDFGNPDADPNVYEDEYDGSDADAFDVHAHSDREDNNPIIEFDPAVHSSDEAYARALQEAEEREIATRLLALAGINDGEVEDTEDHGGNSQDNWEEAEPDQLSYEELLALGEVVGSESRGLSADTIASLPSVNYEAGSSQNGNNDLCVICRLDYEDGETLTVLSCKHTYHSECINNWLKTKKVCPLCSAEVSISGHS